MLRTDVLLILLLLGNYRSTVVGEILLRSFEQSGKVLIRFRRANGKLLKAIVDDFQFDTLN